MALVDCDPNCFVEFPSNQPSFERNWLLSFEDYAVILRNILNLSYRVLFKSLVVYTRIYMFSKIFDKKEPAINIHSISHMKQFLANFLVFSIVL